MNNDTPQIFGDDAHDYPPDPGPFPEHDDDAFPAFRGWAGWDDRVEPLAPGDDYPQPSFSPHEPVPYVPRAYEPDPAYARHLGYPLASGDDRDPWDESDSGYANHVEYLNDPGSAGYPGYRDGDGQDQEAGYAPGVNYPPEGGYAPVISYPPDRGHAADLRFAGDFGYAEDLGFGPGASPVPPMEPLPDYHEQLAAPAHWVAPPRDPRDPREPAQPRETAPPVMSAPLPTMVPPVAPDGRRAFPEEALAPLPQAADPEYGGETSDSLTTESLLHGKRAAPASGWRRSVYRATGGLLRFGESAAEMRRRDLINRVRTPVAGGHHRVAVLSLKGGVGKTTTAVGLGATLATLRGDRVIAVDANPDRGTLSDKVRLETAATIRDLLNERDQVSRYADVRAFTSQAPSRLEVLASDRDPAVSVAFGADDYYDAARMLEHFYSICITDCGTGLLHSAMAGVLQLADQVVLVSSPSVDGARSASATLDWLEAHNYGDLVRNGVVVLSAIRPKRKSTVDLDRLEHHFAARCRAVARIPYDPHLEEGAEIELELISSDTAEAYLALAAAVGDGLAWPRRLTSRPALP
jgi:MinD-like ATPase involved in chromosome partitioning or flagellar assembly